MNSDMINIECNAVIFDVDATLVDTTACIENIWRKWAEKYNIDTQHVLSTDHGRTILETIKTAKLLGIKPEERVVF